jgi:hypothetical protein
MSAIMPSVGFFVGTSAVLTLIIFENENRSFTLVDPSDQEVTKPFIVTISGKKFLVCPELHVNLDDIGPPTQILLLKGQKVNVCGGESQQLSQNVWVTLPVKCPIILKKGARLFNLEMKTHILLDTDTPAFLC